LEAQEQPGLGVRFTFGIHGGNHYLLRGKPVAWQRLAVQPSAFRRAFVVIYPMDVVDLRNFYAHPLGTVARRLIGRGIRRLWTGSTGLRVLGIGYSTPYLGLFREDAERCLAFMPAAQGVVKWPSARPTLTALVDEWDLPLPDGEVDRILLVHALETSHD